jgi:hypothetical protein
MAALPQANAATKKAAVQLYSLEINAFLEEFHKII